jgi:hypothetical protein
MGATRINPLLVVAAVTKIQEGIVVGFQKNAWASNKQKYKDSI